MAIFARVVETGSFSRAARELGLNTSSVSQHIRALELYLGAVLLHRTSRRLSLTEAGQVYYQECIKVVDAAAQGKKRVAALRNEPSGELRIAVSAFMSAKYLIPSLNDFIRRYPALDVRIEVNDRNIDLIENRMDLALRVGAKQDSALLIARQVAKFERILCASPDYLKKFGAITSPDMLTKVDFLLFSPLGEPNTLDLVNEAGLSARIKLNGRIKTNHAETVRVLALQGHGVARVLLENVREDLRAGTLQIILPNWRVNSVHAFVLTPPETSTSLKVMLCAEHIQSYFQRIPHLAP